MLLKSEKEACLLPPPPSTPTAMTTRSRKQRASMAVDGYGEAKKRGWGIQPCPSLKERESNPQITNHDTGIQCNTKEKAVWEHSGINKENSLHTDVDTPMGLGGGEETDQGWKVVVGSVPAIVWDGGRGGPLGKRRIKDGSVQWAPCRLSYGISLILASRKTVMPFHSRTFVQFHWKSC